MSLPYLVSLTESQLSQFLIVNNDDLSILVTRFNVNFFPPEARSTSTDTMTRVARIIDSGNHGMTQRGHKARVKGMGTSARQAANVAANVITQGARAAANFASIFSPGNFARRIQ